MLSNSGMSDTSPLEQAIEFAGSEAKLAALIDFSQVAVNKAKHRGKVSAEMAVAIERATKGAVTTNALRPDLWPPAAQPAEAAE